MFEPESLDPFADLQIDNPAHPEPSLDQVARVEHGVQAGADHARPPVLDCLDLDPFPFARPQGEGHWGTLLDAARAALYLVRSDNSPISSSTAMEISSSAARRDAASSR